MNNQNVLKDIQNMKKRMRLFNEYDWTDDDGEIVESAMDATYREIQGAYEDLLYRIRSEAPELADTLNCTAKENGFKVVDINQK